MSAGSEEPQGEGSADELPRPSRRRPMEIGALVAALLFLAGAVGYVIGSRSSVRPSSAVDVGFLIDMSEHHDQAVRMALMEMAHGEDPTVRGFAQDVVVFQRSELGSMEVLLADHRRSRPDLDPDRPAMAWMSMSTPAGSMPGLATDEQLAQLEAARGAESDRLFLELVTAHHVGGVHMAQYAADHARDPKVRALADRMARYQSVEVREYAQRAARLGYSLPAVDLPDVPADDPNHGAEMGH